MNGLTLGSLFDGIGGFPLAAQRCGIRALWASEIEPNCIAITKRHFPEMRHLGSLTELDGGKIPPVDIISFGSPCQDLSVAGTQKGLSGERSGLFREAIRIIYEMRAATNGVYPTFIIWENVPGAFNSNRGKDFRTVLAEIAKTGISMPDSGKWARAGMVRAGGVDIAWRQLDSQYWGIPQRRKRIFLVADFRGQRAAEILFKCESLLGYSEQGAKERPGIAADSGNRSKTSSTDYLTPWDHQDKRVFTPCGVSPTLAGCDGGGGRNSAGYLFGILGINEASQCVYETAHANEVIRTNKGGVCPTLQARMGTGGNQIPLVLDLEKAQNIILDDDGGKFIDVYTNGICSALRTQTKGHLPCVIGCYPINDGVINGRANGLGIGDEGDPAPTLTGRDRHAIAFFETGQHSFYKQSEISGTLRAAGGSCAGGSETLIVKIERTKLFMRYILRKLTPLECERLQGFPDNWTRYGHTGEEIKDTPRYVAIGNSLAVPCAERVFRGIIAVTGDAMTGCD